MRSSPKGDILGERIDIFTPERRGEIPPLFYRTFEGRLFDACDLCHKSLLSEDTRYLIEKYYFEGELKHEIAVCIECRDEMRSYYSKESQQVLKSIYHRLSEVPKIAGAVVAVQIMNCFLCSAGRNKVSGYFDVAFCQGDKIVIFNLPVMICEKCAIRIFNSLSDKTKKNRNKFLSKHFGFPPNQQFSKRADLIVQSVF